MVTEGCWRALRDDYKRSKPFFTQNVLMTMMWKSVPDAIRSAVMRDMISCDFESGVSYPGCPTVNGSSGKQKKLRQTQGLWCSVVKHLLAHAVEAVGSEYAQFSAEARWLNFEGDRGVYVLQSKMAHLYAGALGIEPRVTDWKEPVPLRLGGMKPQREDYQKLFCDIAAVVLNVIKPMMVAIPAEMPLQLQDDQDAYVMYETVEDARAPYFHVGKAQDETTWQKIATDIKEIFEYDEDEATIARQVAVVTSPPWGSIKGANAVCDAKKSMRHEP